MMLTLYYIYDILYIDKGTQNKSKEKRILKMRISEEFKNYGEAIKKHNLYLSDFDNLEQNYVITMTENVFEKLGRKHFPRKATATETKEITARNYACYMTSIGFFGDRVEKTYTEFGYKPYRIVCTNPSGEKKVERIFRFKFKR